MSSTFARNFISSSRPESFLGTFALTILFSLKQLRLCSVAPGCRAELASTTNFFDWLVELDIINLKFLDHDPRLANDLELNLPMLRIVSFECLRAIDQLTLIAAEPQKTRLCDYSALERDLIRAQSAETLLIDRFDLTIVKQLKNLKYLYNLDSRFFDPMLLSDLEKLEEIYLDKNVLSRSYSKQSQQMAFNKDSDRIHLLSGNFAF